MDASGGNPDAYRTSSSNGSSTISSRYGMLSASNVIQGPISAFLEYSGLLRGRPRHHETEAFISARVSDHFLGQLDEPSAVSSNDGEVSIRIIGAGEQNHDVDGSALPRQVSPSQIEVSGQTTPGLASVLGPEAQSSQPHSRNGHGPAEGISHSLNGIGHSEVSEAGEVGDTDGVNGRDSSYQRYDIQQAARWIEQVLPFSLLLLVVFIRQHVQGFFVTIWIAAVMFKSNDILRKQTALKVWIIHQGERRIPLLVGISIAFTVHVVAVYWWYLNDDLLYPLVMLPPKVIPPFWRAIFIIIVNDSLVRQAAMVLKCLMLISHKNSRGQNYRKQGQMLTLIEYLLLLYRALLPTPVWYRFFLNKDYGSLFSSVITGLYLTFKLTSVVEKVQSFFVALKALSRKEVHYGAYATAEQVNAAGDLCAICQEKMHAPILLRCKHIFCEDCVSEWFERERTCPLCRALVKPAEIRSFSDGSTSLFFQLF